MSGKGRENILSRFWKGKENELFRSGKSISKLLFKPRNGKGFGVSIFRGQ